MNAILNELEEVLPENTEAAKASQGSSTPKKPQQEVLEIQKRMKESQANKIKALEAEKAKAIAAQEEKIKQLSEDLEKIKRGEGTEVVNIDAELKKVREAIDNLNAAERGLRRGAVKFAAVNGVVELWSEVKSGAILTSIKNGATQAAEVNGQGIARISVSEAMDKRKEIKAQYEEKKKHHEGIIANYSDMAGSSFSKFVNERDGKRKSISNLFREGKRELLEKAAKSDNYRELMAALGVNEGGGKNSAASTGRTEKVLGSIFNGIVNSVVFVGAVSNWAKTNTLKESVGAYIEENQKVDDIIREFVPKREEARAQLGKAYINKKDETNALVKEFVKTNSGALLRGIGHPFKAIAGGVRGVTKIFANNRDAFWSMIQQNIAAQPMDEAEPVDTINKDKVVQLDAKRKPATNEGVLPFGIKPLSQDLVVVESPAISEVSAPKLALPAPAPQLMLSEAPRRLMLPEAPRRLMLPEPKQAEPKSSVLPAWVDNNGVYVPFMPKKPDEPLSYCINGKRLPTLSK